jgi:hypothetical protein
MSKTANPRILGGLLLGMLLFAGASIHAQAAPRTVKVEEPGDGTHHYLLPPINLDVIKAFSDRIAASERYALTKAPAELVVFIICVDASRENLLEGDFCTYKIEYRSKKTPEFNMPLGTPGPVVGFRASEIAENIFQAFVTETTEAKLSVAELEPAFRVAEFCSKPANQAPCSGKFR